MTGTYGKLLLFRAVTAAINLLVIRQLNIPFDLIAMLAGLFWTAPAVRAAIVGLEVLNVMLAALGLFFGNFVGGIFGVAVSALCIYVLCLPDVKSRFS